MTIRFHMDEHIHPGVVQGLRARGIDVSTAVEVGLSGADDLAHIRFAQAAGRVIVSHDDDFLRHHARDVEHAGIAYCHQQKYTVGELLSLLLVLHTCHTAEGMLGQVEFL